MNDESTMSVPTAILKMLICCSCQKVFSRRRNQEQRNENPSYLLNCGHSVCEGCCQNVTNVISCGICGSLTQLPSGKNPISSLPRNAYLEGRIFLEKSLRMTDNISYKIAMKQNKISQKSTDMNYLEQMLGYCYECSNADATKSCQQCDCNFCDPCWIRVHSSGKSLQKHVPATNNSLNWSNIEHCKVHEGKVLEFFCRECKVYACPNCIVLNHQGGNHKPVTLQERNQELFENVDKIKGEVSKNMKKMIDASMEVKAMREKVSYLETSYEDLLRQVVHNFVHLHGILQVAEESVLKRLSASENAKRDRLEEMLLQLDRQIETVKFVMDRVDNLKNPERFEKDVLLEKILDTLTTLKNLPCRLVKPKDPGKKGMSDEKPTLFFDESVIERLQNYCTLNIPENDGLELKSDVTDDAVVHFFEAPKLEDICYRQEEDEGSVKSKKSECSDDSKKLVCNTYTLRSSSEPLSVLPMPKMKPLNIVEGHAYPVFISYVKDPGEFYVMRSCLRKQRQKIDVLALTFASKIHTLPKNIQKDEYYLVQYAADNKWYRGRVVDVPPRKNENNETVANIYYLDYGNKQEVPLSRMRDMPMALREEPPLAIKCKLFGCVARKGNWCKGSTKVMLDVLGTSVMTMYVMKVVPECLEVDLSRRGADDSLEHELISLRDMMVFLEYASFAARKEDVKKRNNLRYLTPAMPTEGSFRGLITYVESESLFYVQKIGPDTQYLLLLMDKLDSTYNKGNMKGLIYNPDLDMPCAALYPQDEKWYRGEIIDFPGKERLTVHYVDYGNKETVHWKSVRRLQPEFLKLVPQAIPCSLMEVPLQSQSKWRRDVKDRLDSYSSEIVTVVVVGKKGGKLTVVLYTNKNACINDEMVEDMTNKQEERDCSEVNDFVVIEKHHKQKKGRKKEVTTGEESPKSSDEIFRTEVKVLQASSPSDIYVSLLCFSVRAEELEKELQQFYTESQPKTDAKWEVGDRCAALSSRRQRWYRATIAEILDDKIRVVFKDIVETEDVPVSDIRMLDERFFAYPIGAIKCHLAGIFPPETEWPGLSCKFLQDQLDSYKRIYMTKLGEIDSNSLPIQLWVKKRSQGGALEPTTEEWVVLNDLIVQQGLAVPEKAKQLMLHHIVCKDTVKPVATDQKKIALANDIPSDLLGEIGESINPSVAFDWPPSRPCLKDRFMGEPTYVDTDGVIYIHDEEDKYILDKMQASFLEYYEGSKPQAHDQYWSEGQLCIVRYHLDGGWYRGKVLKVNEDFTYQVQFVDYGNIETCTISEMRKNVKHLDVPTLTRRFVLYGVSPMSPDRQWPIPVTDYMNSSVVEKRCYITVIEKSADTISPSKVKIRVCDEDFDMGENLVGMGLAEFESIGKGGGEAVPIGDIYSELEVPDDFRTFPIEVLIVKYSEFFVHILDHESIPKDIRKVISDFVVLTNEIQCDAEKQESVKDFRKGAPCISLYSDNGTWYRAEILGCDTSENLVLVRYVDYGNEEYVTKDRIRKCLTKWFNVPKMVLNLKLHNVRMNSGVKKSEYVESLTKCLARPGLTAEVVQGGENGYFVEVKQDGVLAYQEMIDNGWMELIVPSERVPAD